ncbi:MAG: hypothetical protein KA536_15960 [Saprospiraceae bacterium]|nr:hypothetical protein [Saprospiraceae bacterium]
MSKFDLNNIYNLVPSIHRSRDAMEVLSFLNKDDNEWNDDMYGPIKALLKIIADEALVMEENLDQLYDDMFIETCADWVVPYIGDLIGYTPLTPVPDLGKTPRSEVANTISYRRRKGTLAVLEQLAFDVTGWKTSAVEYFKILATSQYMNHIRLSNTTFSRINEYAESYNGNDTSLLKTKLLWKQLAFANTPFDSMPKSADVRNIALKRGKYNIQNIGIYLWRINSYQVTKRQASQHNLGLKQYKFNFKNIDQRLYNKVESEKSIDSFAERLNVAMPITRREFHENKPAFYGEDKSITVWNGDVPFLESEVIACNLSDGNWIFKTNDSNVKLAIDPELGRLIFRNDIDNINILVTYQYGFALNMGGGEYEREIEYEGIPMVVNLNDTINDEITTFVAIGGELEINTSKIYDGTIDINIDKSISIFAKNGAFPVLQLDKFEIKATNQDAEIELNGLIIDTQSIVIDDQIKKLTIKNCTLLPEVVKLIIKKPIDVEIENSIVGSIEMVRGGNLKINNSIVAANNTSSYAIAGESDGFCSTLNIENSTIIGKVKTELLKLASNSLFYGDEIESQRTQEGCVRFCYLPKMSKTPLTFKCVHENDKEKASFKSMIYGNEYYCMLNEYCSKPVLTGSDDGCEIGVYHELYQQIKLDNLNQRFNEYLRFGMEVGVFFAT